MTIQAQVSVRSRKLGVLMRDARLAARKTSKECAQAMGVTSGILRAYEEGRRSPSLPELELLGFFLNVPMHQFWGKEVHSTDAPPTGSLNLAAFVNIRQRLIGAQLRQTREKASISVRDLAEQSGLSNSRIKTYELGERPIPLPELEGLVGLLGGQFDTMFDQAGPVGQWMGQQKAIQDFLQLPVELQNFVCKPINRPYLELAQKLSGMSAEKLRGVAEDLLDITL
ncbi:MAG: helix-turn-helix transcriptional regulator [Anaerolineales bacterium]|jgi:transcriptional regulator with XRE-family HTH domain